MRLLGCEGSSNPGRAPNQLWELGQSACLSEPLFPHP